jgi:hypothetical protein
MRECLGETFTNIIYHSIIKWALRTSFLFQTYDNKILDDIALLFTTKYAKSNEIIMDIENPVDALVICIEGKINNLPIGTIFNDEYYEASGCLEDDLIKDGNGMYAYLPFSQLSQAISAV